MLWGRQFWPKSLYGQILLVVALALFLAQSINAFMLLSGAHNRAVIEAATMVVGRVVNQIERKREHQLQLDQTPHEDRGPGDKFRRRLPGISISIDAAPISIDRYQLESDLADRVTEFLEQTDAELTDIRISSGSKTLLPAHLQRSPQRRIRMDAIRSDGRLSSKFAVLFSARMADGQWINAAGLVRPSDAGSVIALMIQTLTLYIAVLVPLAWIVRRVSKPLEKLTGRVQRIGVTDDIPPLPSEGPADVRQLIDAFNAMQSRVSILLGEKDVMLGAIGHDLKTPLAALRVRVESVEDDNERDKMASTIDEMVTILDDILTLARLGKSGEELQRTDIGALVGSVVEDFECAIFIEPEMRIVAAVRPVLVRRALRNLIGNAIAYGKKAEITVSSNATHVLIQIDDSGPGIKPEAIEPMFEPFARAETSRNRITGGSGLGLTLARAIAQAHGGTVFLENRTEGGLRAILSVSA